MMHFRLNPTVLLATILILGLMITFTQSTFINLTLVVLALAYLALNRVAFKKVVLILLFVLPLAFGTWWSFILYGTGDTWHSAWLFATRIYAYVALGLTLTLTWPVKLLLFSLTQSAHLSPTFAYGLLAPFNLLHKLRQQIKLIFYAGQVRGVPYHFWQARLYLKIIVVALAWSNDLAEAMTSHGFSEGFARTNVTKIPLPRWQWLCPLVIAGLLLSVALILRPW